MALRTCGRFRVSVATPSRTLKRNSSPILNLSLSLSLSGQRRLRASLAAQPKSPVHARRRWAPPAASPSADYLNQPVQLRHVGYRREEHQVIAPGFFLTPHQLDDNL